MDIFARKVIMKTLNRYNIYNTPLQFHYLSKYDTKKKIIVYPIVNRFPKLNDFTLRVQNIYNEDFYNETTIYYI